MISMNKYIINIIIKSLVYWLVIINSFAQDTLPLFEPQKPAKPLKFCTAQKEWIKIVENLEDWNDEYCSVSTACPR